MSLWSQGKQKYSDAFTYTQEWPPSSQHFSPYTSAMGPQYSSGIMVPSPLQVGGVGVGDGVGSGVAGLALHLPSSKSYTQLGFSLQCLSASPHSRECMSLWSQGKQKYSDAFTYTQAWPPSTQHFSPYTSAMGPQYSPGIMVPSPLQAASTAATSPRRGRTTRRYIMFGKTRLNQTWSNNKRKSAFSLNS